MVNMSEKEKMEDQKLGEAAGGENFHKQFDLTEKEVLDFMYKAPKETVRCAECGKLFGVPFFWVQKVANPYYAPHFYSCSDHENNDFVESIDISKWQKSIK